MSSFVALYSGAVVLLGGCGPTGDGEPSEPSPSEVRAVRQRVASADEVGSTSLVSPEGSVSASAPFWPQTTPAVAVGNGLYLVVWSEGVNRGPPDLHAVRVRASDGVVLDETPLRIATGSQVEHKPAAAFDGTNFLVTWEDHRQGSPLLYGARVRASDGAVLDTPRLISKSPVSGFPQYNGSVAFDGTNFLVTWEGIYSFSMFGPLTYGIQGIRVRPSDGQPIESTSFAIARLNPDGAIPSPRVSCGGGRCLVVWTSSAPGSTWSDLMGTRLEAATGKRLDASPLRFTQTAGVNERYASVTSDGKDFLVTWSTGGSSTSGPLFGARVRGSDGALLESTPFTVADNQLGQAAQVTFDGSDYRVAWKGTRDGVERLGSTRVSPRAAVASGAELLLSPLTSAFTGYSDPVGLAAAGRGRFLVAYGQQDPALGMSRLRLRQVVDLANGEACTEGAGCQSGFCVDGVCCESACGGGAGNDCQACSVAAGGAADGTCGAVRAEAAVVCRPTAVACDVAEVCDGTRLACPDDEPSASEPDLSGDKCEDTADDVVSFLTALGPESLEPSFGQSLLAKAEAASKSLQQGEAKAAEGQLRALLQQVRAQRGKKLSVSAADTLIAALTGLLGA
ncbi:MAG TPA: hypothetical protein VEY88_13280 [Archangium sp.]|nr:hypothetical protein [Archangium sp.]